MIRLIAVLLLLGGIAAADELSDIDMQSIVELADGIAKGHVISVQEIEHTNRDGELVPYRNVKVLIQTTKGKFRIFRASKIDDDWRLDNEEIERMAARHKFLAMIENRKKAAEANSQ